MVTTGAIRRCKDSVSLSPSTNQHPVIYHNRNCFIRSLFECTFYFLQPFWQCSGVLCDVNVVLCMVFIQELSPLYLLCYRQQLSAEPFELHLMLLVVLVINCFTFLIFSVVHELATCVELRVAFSWARHVRLQPAMCNLLRKIHRNKLACKKKNI